MAIDAGDVVITFLGDTTQLDKTFAAVQGKSTEISEQAAQSTVQLKAAQAELRAALAAVSAEGGNTVANFERLAIAEDRLAQAATAAKAAHAELKPKIEEAGLATELASDFTSELTGKLFGLLGIFALLETAKGFVESTQKSVLELGKLSEITGINIKTLAGLEHVAESSGIRMESLAGGLEKLGKNQVLAVEHAGNQRKAFQDLGISLADLQNLSPDQLFFRVASALGHTTNSATALFAIQTLMGRGASELLPVFKEHADDLETLAEHEGKLSGVTNEAFQSAKDWEKQMANLHQTMRALMIPVLEYLVPLLKAIEADGTGVAFVVRTLAAGIAAMWHSVLDGTTAGAKVLVDIMHGNFQQALADSMIGNEQIKQNWGQAWKKIQDDADNSLHFIHGLWEKAKPFEPGQQQQDHLGGTAKLTTEQLIAQAKAASEGVIAQIELRKQRNTLAYKQGEIDAKTWAEADVKATVDARMEHERFLAEVVSIYKKAGDAVKAKTAQQELDNQRVKDGAKQAEDLSKAISDGQKATATFNKDLVEFSKHVSDGEKEAKKLFDPLVQMEEHPPLTALMKNVLALNVDLRKLGADGIGTLAQKFDQASKAEQRLNDLGIHEGKLWLQVQAAKLKAYIDVEHAAGRSAKAEEHQLQQVQRDLDKFDQKLKSDIPTWVQMQEQMRSAVEDFTSDLGKGFAAAIQGQESAGKAILQSVGQMIGKLCEMWAKYFAAKAIADVFWHPAMAAAEFAAAVALEIAGALAGSLGGSGGGGGASGGGGGGQVTIEKSPGTTAGGVSSPTQNIPHLGTGAIVTDRTMAMLGDSPTGGRQAEAVIPLGDPRALAMLRHAVGSGGGGGEIHICLESDIVQTVKRIDSTVKSGKAYLTSSNTKRLTRRSV